MTWHHTGTSNGGRKNRHTPLLSQFVFPGGYLGERGVADTVAASPPGRGVNRAASGSLRSQADADGLLAGVDQLPIATNAERIIGNPAQGHPDLLARPIEIPFGAKKDKLISGPEVLLDLGRGLVPEPAWADVDVNDPRMGAPKIWLILL